MQAQKILAASAVAITISAAWPAYSIEQIKPEPGAFSHHFEKSAWFTEAWLPSKAKALAELKSLESAAVWLNSKPAPAAFDGKVVVVHFGTYTCINWLRTVPYVRAWEDKYAGLGLAVLTVHTPEFEFEKNLDNVKLAIAERLIKHPVAIDNEQTIWRAFDNQYWPALYIIDHLGRIRYHHFGEGSYEKSEMMIRTLLAEAGSSIPAPSTGNVSGLGLEAAADWSNLKSFEAYLGHERMQNFASLGKIVLNTPSEYQLPISAKLNEWALSGDWTIKKDASALNTPGGKISYRFHARDVHIVMGPSTSGKPTRFRVLLDGQPPGTAHGVDVDESGMGTVNQQKLYQIIRQATPIVDRQIEIEFIDPDVELFAFTFG